MRICLFNWTNELITEASWETICYSLSCTLDVTVTIEVLLLWIISSCDHKTLLNSCKSLKSMYAIEETESHSKKNWHQTSKQNHSQSQDNLNQASKKHKDTGSDSRDSNSPAWKRRPIWRSQLKIPSINWSKLIKKGGIPRTFLHLMLQIKIIPPHPGYKITQHSNFWFTTSLSMWRGLGIRNNCVYCIVLIVGLACDWCVTY